MPDDPRWLLRPSKISHKLIVAAAGPQEKVYAQLERLLPVGGLRHFIEQHPEFRHCEKQGVMYIEWQFGVPRAPASAATGAPAPAEARALSPTPASNSGDQGANDNNSPSPADSLGSWSIHSVAPSAASGARSALPPGATSGDTVHDVHDGDDRSDLSDFWRIGPLAGSGHDPASGG